MASYLDALNAQISSNPYGYVQPTQPQASTAATSPQSTYQPISWGGTPTASLENAFGQYGSQYQQPSQSSQFYGQAAGQLSQPSQSSQTYGAMSGYLSQPTASGSMFGAAQSALGGPTNSTSLYNQIGSQYLQPSASSQVLGAVGGGLSGPSSAQQWYGQNGGAYGAPTAIGALSASNPYGAPLIGEQLGAMGMDMYGNSTYSQDNLGNVMATANGPSELTQNGGQIAGLYNGANNVQQFQSANGSQLSGPGALEQFASSAMNGSSPYYDLVGKEGRAALDQAAAARGGYGSGGALASLGNYQAHLDAENFQNMGQLQGAAQSAQNSRLGLGANVANMASGEALNQGNALQGLYQNQFNDRMQGAQLGLQAAGQADTSNFNRLSGIGNYANMADQATLSRLGGQASLAGAASASGLDYLNGGLNAANAADASGLARTSLLGQLAGQSDSQRLAGLAGISGLAGQADSTTAQNYGILGNLAGMTDTQGLNRYNAAMSGANQVDAQTIARLGLQGSLAGQTDSTGLNWLNSYFNQAGQAQQAGQARNDAEYQQQLQLAALQAGLFGQFYGAGGQQSVEAGTGSATAGVGGAASAAGLQQQGNKNVLSTAGSIFGWL